MDINDFLSFARSVMNDHNLQNWKVELDRAVMRNGQCDHRNKVLSFSKHFIQRNKEEMILNTLLHEIAHALVGSNHGHDLTWERKCIEIGYKNPTRCSNSDMPKGNYQATCDKCGPLEIYRHRLSKKVYTHVACKTTISWKGIIS